MRAILCRIDNFRRALVVKGGIAEIGILPIEQELHPSIAPARIIYTLAAVDIHEKRIVNKVRTGARNGDLGIVHRSVRDSAVTAAGQI